jgi:hypothetical protein
MKTVVALLLCGVLVVAGCGGAPVKLSADPGMVTDPSKGREIEAEACGFQLLLFIPIRTNSRLKRAYLNLKEQAGNDVIGNVYVRDSWWYGLVGTLYCTELRATAYPRNT